MRPHPIYDSPMETIASLALTGAGVGIIVFTLCYMVFFKWHKTPSGVAILLFTLSLSLVMALGIISRITGGDYFLREWLMVIVAVLCLLTAWGLIGLLLYGWLRGQKPLDLVERASMKRAPTGNVTTTPEEAP